MYNNASYRQFLVSGTTSFTFSPVGVDRENATCHHGVDRGDGKSACEPDPGNDGIWFMGYKVTNPTAGSLSL